jgi:tryptophanyl-tRNA synthetase
MAEKKRVLSGMRPTGRMHLGHLVGALENWVNLQEQYQCFFFVADWHALTTDYADTRGLTDSTFQMIVDWLATGLDPEKSTFFVQSHILEHAELNLLLSMITPLGWLERVPSYKEQRDNIRDKDLNNYGFLGYPVLQAADILIYRANYVPVGEDQVAHVELTREIARRFNSFYLYPQDSLFQDEKASEIMQKLTGIKGANFHDQARQGFLGWQKEMEDTSPGHAREQILAAGVPAEHFSVFPEPEALLTPIPRLAGLDGRKMSKSYGNMIELGESPASIREKVKGMITDPQRARREDPGRPEVCPVFSYHQRYSPADATAQIEQDCRAAKIGCVDCKKQMAENLVQALAPMQERRHHYESNPGEVWEILTEGTRRAQRETAQTLDQVRLAMHMVPQVKHYEGSAATGEPATLNLDLEE